jgi:hypothetical protein
MESYLSMMTEYNHLCHIFLALQNDILIKIVVP